MLFFSLPHDVPPALNHLTGLTLQWCLLTLDSWGSWNSCNCTYKEARAMWNDIHMSFNCFKLWFMGKKMWCETDKPKVWWGKFFLRDWCSLCPNVTVSSYPSTLWPSNAWTTPRSRWTLSEKKQCGHRSEISENIDQEIIRRREKIRIKFEGFHNIWWSYGYNI